MKEESWAMIEALIHHMESDTNFEDEMEEQDVAEDPNEDDEQKADDINDGIDELENYEKNDVKNRSDEMGPGTGIGIRSKSTQAFVQGLGSGTGHGFYLNECREVIGDGTYNNDDEDDKQEVDDPNECIDELEMDEKNEVENYDEFTDSDEGERHELDLEDLDKYEGDLNEDEDKDDMKENAKKRRRSNDENEDENGAKRHKKSLIGYNDSRAINLNVVKLVGASDASAKIEGGILTRLDINRIPKSRSGGMPLLVQGGSS